MHPATGASAQITMYGRLDLTVAQQTDAADNQEIRNRSGGLIGSTRYSGTVNYHYGMSGFTFGAQYGEAEKNPSGGKADDQPDNLGVVKLGGLIGTGKNVSNQKHQAWLMSAVMPVSALGQLRLSYGQLKNEDTGVVRDKQLGLGFHYTMSKRTTVYADVVSEKRDNMAANLNTTGYDFGIKHNF